VLAAIGAMEHPDVGSKPAAPEDLPELKPLPDLPLPLPAEHPEHPEAVSHFEPVPPPDVTPSDEPQRPPDQPPVLDPEAYLAAMEQAAMERAVLSRLPADLPHVAARRDADVTHRRVRLVAIATALAVVLGVAAVLFWYRPACCGDGIVLPPSTVETGVPGIGTGPGGGGAASPRPGATAKPGASAPGQPGGAPTAPPGQGASPKPAAAASSQAPPPPASAPLRASYRTTASGLLGILGYRGEITLSNPNGTAATDWTVVVQLAGNNQVEASNGAVYLQLDNRVTFIPADTGNVVPAHGSTTFTFDVRGLLTDDPRSCTVNGRSCGG
jgi:hypothetical protein